ncbi:hypothetical protein N7528_009065 [Penicillium herquei]|nr:hypothetical protein N7528_009065 [Penicillium herquei]
MGQITRSRVSIWGYQLPLVSVNTLLNLWKKTILSLMSLNQVWEAASATPFYPIISKDNQFAVGFNLLICAVLAGGLFGLNRSFASLFTLGLPSALAAG